VPDLGGFDDFRRPIRITPSHLGRALSQKAIPYHYRPVPLYEYWNFHLNKQGKANENLGYRSPNWDTGIPFVRHPLNYDLEPYNFVRIEGHIGKNYQDVISELINQKEVNRLPIDLVAVKTGYNESNIPLPTAIEGCHFQDLESLYSAFREELLCQICELLKHLYNFPYPPEGPVRTRVDRAPRLTTLRRCAPNFRYFTRTVGQYAENPGTFFGSGGGFMGFFGVPGYVNYTLGIITRLNNLALTVSETLLDFDFDSFRNVYDPLLGTLESVNRNLIFITNDAEDDTPTNPNVDLEELSDQFDHFLYACKLDSFRRIRQEYEARVERLREQLLLSNFARKHRGLQHKAGVPMGGTFVMVYHGEEQQDRIPRLPGFFTIGGQVIEGGSPLPGVSLIVVGTSLGTTTDFDGNFRLSGVSLPARLRAAFIGFPSREILVTSSASALIIDFSAAPPEDIPSGRFSDLPVGAVIADFYLPYLCCSDCAPVQFVLPRVPPTFNWEQEGCTDPNGNGMISITASGGTAPYEYSTDSGANWILLEAAPIEMVDSTQVQIRDAEGTVSIRRTIELLPPFVAFQLGRGDCNPEGTEFTVTFEITGGRPPYTVLTETTRSTVPAGQNGTLIVASGQGAEVRITDSSEPTCEQRITVEPVTCPEPCGLPCNGITRELGYPFWMQRGGRLTYFDVQLVVSNFEITLANGDRIPVDTGQLTDILNPDRNLDINNFTRFWNRAIPRANEFIREQLQDQLEIDEPAITLNFVQNASPNFTELRISHFECHQFNFSLELQFISEREDTRPIYFRRLNYTQDGFTFSENVDNIDPPHFNTGSLPAFNVIVRNLCEPDAPERPLCEETFETSIFIDPSGFDVFLGTEAPDGLPKLWILEHGSPAMVAGNGMQSSLQGNTNYEAKVIVVNPDTTCAAIAVREINIPIIF